MAMSGLVALVVQDALDEIKQVFKDSSFTPIKTVAPSTPALAGSSLTGAEITIRFAPASKCCLANS